MNSNCYTRKFLENVKLKMSLTLTLWALIDVRQREHSDIHVEYAGSEITTVKSRLGVPRKDYFQMVMRLIDQFAWRVHSSWRQVLGLY